MPQNSNGPLLAALLSLYILVCIVVIYGIMWSNSSVKDKQPIMNFYDGEGLSTADTDNRLQSEDYRMTISHDSEVTESMHIEIENLVKDEQERLV